MLIGPLLPFKVLLPVAKLVVKSITTPVVAAGRIGPQVVRKTFEDNPNTREMVFKITKSAANKYITSELIKSYHEPSGD